MGKSGIITKKDAGKDNEAYHDIITLMKIYQKTGIAHMKDKTFDERYYVLTLMGMARQLGDRLNRGFTVRLICWRMQRVIRNCIWQTMRISLRG